MARLLVLMSLLISARARAEPPSLEQRVDALERHEDVAYRVRHPPLTMTNGPRGFRGAYHVYLSGIEIDRDQLYELLDRPDLVKAHHRRLRIGEIASLGGLALGIGGIALAIGENGNTSLQDLGVAGAIGGAVGMIVGVAYLANDEPISKQETAELIGEYDEHAATSAQLHPFAVPSGGGLALAGAF